MKFFGIEISRNRILHTLFGWSMILPAKAEPEKQPLEITVEDEDCFAPLNISDQSILRRTDPLLMTRQERHENIVRYWMESKGYSRAEVDKPLTDARMEEIGRVTYGRYSDQTAIHLRKVKNEITLRDVPPSRAVSSRWTCEQEL